jgi:glycosyltransferase involved in cell wall biosynthesis
MISSTRTTPIRVAHVIQNLNFGGMEKVLNNLARSLPSLGFEIHIVVLQYQGQFASGLESWATIHQVPPMGRLSLLWPRELVATLRGIAPDIVHSHSGVWLKAARAARQAGIRATIHTEHGRPDQISASDLWLDRQAAKLTRTLIAVSDPLAATLRRQVARDPEQVTVIINGVDTERLQPVADAGAQRAALGLPTNGLVIGSIGRLEPVKNYPLALRALARLRQQGTARPVSLVVAGDGSERAALMALAAELGIGDAIQFLGWRTDAEALYPLFDLFTLPSLSEGTSISLLEAMSCAVCPVVTDVGGNRDVLGQQLASLLVPSDDDQALAASWARMLGDDDARRAAGQVARARVQANFSLDKMVRQHADLYRRSVGARP